MIRQTEYSQMVESKESILLILDGMLRTKRMAESVRCELAESHTRIHRLSMEGYRGPKSRLVGTPMLSDEFLKLVRHASRNDRWIVEIEHDTSAPNEALGGYNLTYFLDKFNVEAPAMRYVQLAAARTPVAIEAYLLPQHAMVTITEFSNQPRWLGSDYVDPVLLEHTELAAELNKEWQS